MIGLLLLGFVAGVFNVVRASGEMASRSKGEGGDGP
jgi:F0F1-type ATP synthase assembly protein I